MNTETNNHVYENEKEIHGTQSSPKCEKESMKEREKELTVHTGEIFAVFTSATET